MQLPLDTGNERGVVTLDTSFLLFSISLGLDQAVTVNSAKSTGALEPSASHHVQQFHWSSSSIFKVSKKKKLYKALVKS